MKNRHGRSCRLRMWAWEGLSGKGVSGICQGTQKPECWGAAANCLKEWNLVYGRHLFEFHWGFLSGIRLAVWSTDEVRVKGIASVDGSLPFSFGGCLSLYLQKLWTFRRDLVERPRGGALRTGEAHFSAGRLQSCSVIVQPWSLPIVLLISAKSLVLLKNYVKILNLVADPGSEAGNPQTAFYSIDKLRTLAESSGERLALTRWENWGLVMGSPPWPWVLPLLSTVLTDGVRT